MFSCFNTTNAQENQHWFSISSENDFLGLAVASDRYYSYGERIDYLRRINSKDSNDRFFNLRFHLEGHTPKHKGKLNSETFRRPFFGWLHANFLRLSSNEKKYFIYGLDIGISGPLAMAGDYQNWSHEKLTSSLFVDGWQNQTPNKIGINILFDYKKTLFQFRNHSVRIGSEQSLGNIFTYLSPTINYQFNIDQNPTYLPFNYSNKMISRFTMETSVGLKYEFHNATLQGEYFSHSKNYLRNEVIYSTLLVADFGIRYSINHLTIYLKNSFNTKRVKESDFHNYGLLGLGFNW